MRCNREAERLAFRASSLTSISPYRLRSVTVIPRKLNDRVAGATLALLSVIFSSKRGSIMRTLKFLPAIAALMGATALVQPASAFTLYDFRHIVVIYEENHSFDNL